MAVTDFLFQGSPPPSVTTYGSSTSNLPAWYSDYLQGVLAKGNAVAGEEYQPYGGPRVQDFVNDQRNAFQSVRENFGRYQPLGMQATGFTQQAAAINPLANARPMLDQAAAGSSLGAASPFLNTAAQTAPGVIGNYMNPFTDQVVNRIGELAGRNLSENLMPAIGDTFTRAGQFGSSRQQQMTGRALRDTQEAALEAQSNALHQGYGQAMSAAQNDLSRAGALANTAGNLAGEDFSRRANIGQVIGNLSTANQNALINAGTAQNSIAQGLQGMSLKDAAALQDVGTAQQQFGQQNLNTAYQDFVEQRDYPKTQLGFMSNLARGYQVPTSTNTSGTAPASSYSASGLSALAGGLGGLYSLFGQNKARGGRVRKAPVPRGALAMMKG